MENFYEVLGINVNASKEEIKAAYNKMVKIHHPDRNNDHVSSKAMTLLFNEAYDVLMDEEKRKAYDIKHGVIQAEVKTKMIYIDRPVKSIDWSIVIGTIAAILLVILFIPVLFGDRK